MSREILDFSSPLPFVAADADAYRRLKNVVPINQPAAVLEHSPGPVPDGACVNSWPFWHARLAAAARSAVPASRFPGSLLPGPGAGNATVDSGALAYARFRASASRAGGMIRSDRPAFGRRSSPRLERWPWPGIPQPEFDEIAFGPPSEPPASADELAEAARLRPGRDGIRRATQMWCPGREGPEVHEPLLRALLDRFPEAASDPAPFAWELEEYFAHLVEARVWNGHGHGFWNGFWLEVGLAPIEAIVPTELAVTSRVAAELATLCERGFAPLIINEHGCDTDGTHRLLAAWLFNLCRALDPRRLDDPVRHAGHLRDRARDWVEGRLAPYARPRPLLVREGLRFLAEACDDPELWKVVVSVCRSAQARPAVWRLPTTFLREHSWETVVKRDYDADGRVVRVDPRAYAVLAADPHLVLPARGPYHRTDRALLPWFDVLAINRS